jgi:hypothetical protein
MTAPIVHRERPVLEAEWVEGLLARHGMAVERETAEEIASILASATRVDATAVDQRDAAR